MNQDFNFRGFCLVFSLQFIVKTLKEILFHLNNNICVIFLSKDVCLTLEKVRENETIVSSTKHTSLNMDKNPPSS